MSVINFIYNCIRPLLFSLDAEIAHNISLNLLRFLPEKLFLQNTQQNFNQDKQLFSANKIPNKLLEKAVSAMGLNFSHPIGLAAGLDKNAQYLNVLSKIGFSFIEVGTVTPRAQKGNAKPRLFRLPQAQALINHMGFNNLGVDKLVENVIQANYQGILGINIGKNKDTPLNAAVADYCYCLRKVYPYASYVTINISSPNTQNLRLLQENEFLCVLLKELTQEQKILSQILQRFVPLVVKISPDESDETLKQIAILCLKNGISGIIATNTTISRESVLGLKYSNESGGLSGKPLAGLSTHSLRILKEVIGNELSLIGSGGIDNINTVNDKLNAGATLLQIYTGLIYKGPGLVNALLA